MPLIVTATDTEVGKTVVSAILLTRYAAELPLAYWKPIASGARDERDTETVGTLADERVEILPETFLFQEPLSPHLAARLDGKRVESDQIVDQLARLREESSERGLVIEGIGGLLVPLTDEGEMLSDLFVTLRLPLLVVARSTLGTLNHTLLTLEALRRRDLEVAGVVLVGPPNEENRKAIESMGQVRIVAEVPLLETLDRDSVARVARDFDDDAHLRRFLP